ncbi:hypothetical protein HMPREF9123_2652 [Neisseria bacilliformis ATCC BAA-1200]|uniref:Uncharacterized protein n=1 Tax=Neisseria bacilliformis ATCC BAA-1200 TaxID=888742 RepID=F2BFZ5_9NEIS|nr:hypothetical protein HMPREF9123_2652 [Neisseria bacilliformis ATCC BAA-1200]
MSSSIKVSDWQGFQTASRRKRPSEKNAARAQGQKEAAGRIRQGTHFSKQSGRPRSLSRGKRPSENKVSAQPKRSGRRSDTCIRQPPKRA